MVFQTCTVKTSISLQPTPLCLWSTTKSMAFFSSFRTLSDVVPSCLLHPLTSLSWKRTSGIWNAKLWCLPLRQLRLSVRHDTPLNIGQDQSPASMCERRVMSTSVLAILRQEKETWDVWNAYRGRLLPRLQGLHLPSTSGALPAWTLVLLSSWVLATTLGGTCLGLFFKF